MSKIRVQRSPDQTSSERELIDRGTGIAERSAMNGAPTTLFGLARGSEGEINFAQAHPKGVIGGGQDSRIRWLMR